MILKEAFRYQNHLNSLIDHSIAYLQFEGNLMRVEQQHMRKKSNSDAEDEVITLPKTSDLEYTPNTVIDFIMDVLEEKEKLTDAIDVTKSKSEINIDSAMAMNKVKQNISYTLNDIVKKKSSENITRGTDYKFNAEGNQVPYTYEIKQVKTIDFDRNKVKAIVKRLNKETDEVSLKRDKLEVDLEVVHSPAYDVSDTFEDCLEIFVTKTSDKEE